MDRTESGDPLHLILICENSGEGNTDTDQLNIHLLQEFPASSFQLNFNAYLMSGLFLPLLGLVKNTKRDKESQVIK